MATAGHCARCQRPAPRGLWDSNCPPDDPSFDDPDFIGWEAFEGGDILVCPGCMTSEELIELAEDFMNDDDLRAHLIERGRSPEEAEAAIMEWERQAEEEKD